MTLLQIHIFITIAQTGSFTKAGEKLNMTQSAVSQTLAGMESELGLVLFHRGKNGVSLTDAGQRLIVCAREIVSGEERFNQVSSSIKGLQAGRLTIGCFPSFMAGRMPDVLKGFHERYPHLSIEFREGNYDEIAKWLFEGTIDVGLNVFADAPLAFVPLLEDPLLAVLPKEHRYANLEEITLEQILEEPFIRDTGCEHFLEKLFPDTALQPKYQFGVRDTFAILSMVQAGLGITILPRLSVPKHLFSIHVSQLKPRFVRTIGLCYHTRRSLSPGTSAFIQYVIESYKAGDEVQ